MDGADSNKVYTNTTLIRIPFSSLWANISKTFKYFLELT